jgi:SynChlorMet cassette protein ScmC
MIGLIWCSPSRCVLACYPPGRPIASKKPPSKPGTLFAQHGRLHRAKHIVDHQEHSSYLLTLGDHLGWRFTGSPGTESWLNRMARILNFREGEEGGLVHVNFRRRSSSLKLLISRILRRDNPLTEPLCGKRDVPVDGWTMRDFGVIRIWSHSDVPDLICELSPWRSDSRELVMMWYALQAIYPGIVQGGGLPLHAALVSRGGMGVLLAGAEGTGKSTCCRRMSKEWTVLADDGVLIVPGNKSSYAAHPLPTWSELIMGQSERTCTVEHGVPLSAIFFLEKASQDEVVPLGQGHASVMINASASYVARQGWKKPDPGQDRCLKTMIFENSCGIAKTVPSYLLRVSPSGKFWKPMERALHRSTQSLHGVLEVANVSQSG